MSLNIVALPNGTLQVSMDNTAEIGMCENILAYDTLPSECRERVVRVMESLKQQQTMRFKP